MIKPARLIFKDGVGERKQAAMSVKEAKIQEQSTVHDYTMEVSTISKRKDNVPTTPSKIPAGKKSKTSLKEAEVSNLTILEAIQSLEKNFNEQLSQLREQAKQTSTMVASLAKAVQFNAEEVKECKGKINELERCNDRLSKENVELKERIREQERYKMRWCLKLRGLSERKDENVRADGHSSIQ